MIVHLQGGEEALEPRGWTGCRAKWIGLAWPVSTVASSPGRSGRSSWVATPIWYAVPSSSTPVRATRPRRRSAPRMRLLEGVDGARPRNRSLRCRPDPERAEPGPDDARRLGSRIGPFRARRGGQPRDRLDRAGHRRDRVLDEYEDLQAGLERMVKLDGTPEDPALEGGDRLLRHMELDPAPRRVVVNAGRRGSVPIGERTSDNRVHVRREAVLLHTCTHSYIVGGLAFAVGHTSGRPAPTVSGQNGSDPPDRHTPIGTAEGWHVHAHATLRRGSLPTIDPLREGRRAATEASAQDRGRRRRGDPHRP